MSRIALAFAMGISLLGISANNASAQLVEKKTLSLTGSIGVSGADSNQDEQCAQAGLNAFGAP